MAESNQVEVAKPAAEPAKEAEFTDRQAFDEFGQVPEPTVIPTPAPDAAKPAAPSTPVAPEPAKLPSHPRSLVRRALEYGASQEQINAASLDELDSFVSDQDTFRENAARAPKPDAKDPAQDDIDWGLRSDGTPLKESDFEPGMAALIKRQHREMKELRATVATREVEHAAKTIDGAFANLDNPVFGSGAAAEITKEEFSARLRLLRAAGIDLNNPPSTPVIEKKLKAVMSELGISAKKESPKKEPENAYAEAANGNGRITKEQWDEAGVAVPTKGNGKPVKGQRAAMQAASEWLKKKAAGSQPYEDSSDYDVG